MIKAIKNHFLFINETDQLVVERLYASQRQIPLMYGILIINMLVLCRNLYGQAPLFLTVVLPGILILAGSIRMIAWIRLRPRGVKAVNARKSLGITIAVTGALSIILSIWAYLLFQHAGIHARYHIIFFIIMTIMACIFCLVSIPRASIVLACFSAIPASVFLFLLGNHTYDAIAINLIMVVGTLVFVIANRDRYFRNAVESKARLKKANARMNTLANIDPLTNFSNRRSFFNRLTIETSFSSSKPPKTLFLMLIDLDDFKPINDLYGHGYGDKILKRVSTRISKAVPSNCYFARLGGDEFGVICFTSNQAETQKLGLQILDAINKPITVEHIRTKIGGTIGVATFPDDSDIGEDLFEQADFALCYAKQFSRGHVVFFENQHSDYILSTARISKHLAVADLQTELSVRFQPIWNCATNRLVGFETLARWQSPALGNVPPDDFIPVAETSGMIHTITSIIFEKAFVEAKRWPCHLKIGLNISPIDIANEGIVETLLQLCKKHGIDSKRVTIEITETAVMKNYELSTSRLKAFREAGVSIAMDDFGAGNSSLSYLQKLPLDHVKLDKSFVQATIEDEKGKIIASTLITLCKSLGLGCIAEGIESEGQLQALQQLGCTTFQGYYFSVPLLPEQTLAFVNKQM
ncbi:putative bifunctional diguanylate cyclase/phosphodiesterase [Maritalea myrionectae]|uniref:putative bifunctional diguanylate cyclase/phosphodiesterase n=1 Tax=Maritalea myrionectae TaxID=454601 RepID=UPI00146CE348|nr:EAL domain-containing protein [Maritalea myrionectae]